MVPWLAFVVLYLAATPLQAAPEPAHVPIPGGLNGKTCYECHILGSGVVLPSQERPRKYSVASAWSTYLKSPHGRQWLLGNDRAPDCTDCHQTQVWSEILSVSDPASPIHPDHLPRTCARCHGKGMLTAKVSQGSMHLELNPASLLPGRALEVRYGFLPGIMKLEEAYKIGPFNVVAVVYFFFLVLTVGTLTTVSCYMVLDLRRKLKERASEKESDQP